MAVPTVVTTSVTSKTTSSFVAGGNVTSDGGKAVTARGIVYSFNPYSDGGNPSCGGGAPNASYNQGSTSNGTGTGSFSSSVSGLKVGTYVWQYRAYAINADGVGYGEIMLAALTTVNTPTVRTDSVNNIKNTTIQGTSTCLVGDYSLVLGNGLVWGTSPNPTVDTSKLAPYGQRANQYNYVGYSNWLLCDGQSYYDKYGVYYSQWTGTTPTLTLTGLTPNTTYYIRGFAYEKAGSTYYVGYGDNVEFTTLPNTPTVATNAITDILQNTATGGGSITFSGGSSITAKGICWNTGGTPTISDAHTHNGTGTGSFTSYLTGLTIQTLYYVRAYATNSYGTGYGNEVTFSTIGSFPTVFTSAVTITSTNTASGGGIVLTSGDTAVTARGICWNTSPNPTTSNSHTHNGTGIGSFASTLTGLTVNTPYYVRAYATNTDGTSYGNQETFEIVFDAPTLTGSTSGNSINLQITDNNTYKEQYEIYYSGFSSQGTFVPFSETSGTNANDYGYNGYDGTLGGGATFVNSGRTGYCAYISSALRYVDFGNHFQFNVDTVPFTIALWVFNKRTLSNVDILGTAYSSSGYVFGFGNLATANDKLHFYRTGSSGWGRFVYANQALGSGWHHLAVTYDGSNTASGMTLYYDGNKLTTIVYSDMPAGGGHETFRIGTRGFADNFAGLVEDFRVFDKALNEQNILDIYNDNAENEYIATIDSPDTTYADTGLTCGDYSYLTRCKIDSVSPTIYSDFSNVYSDTLIIAPSNLTGTSTFTGITLSWIDNNTDCTIDGNYVYLFTGGTWVEINDASYSATTYTVTGLTPLTIYQFKVTAHSGTTEKDSEYFAITTLDPTPYNLAASGITQFTADLTWDLVAPPAYGTSIEIRLKLASQSIVDLQTVASISPSATTYTLTGLTHNTAYDVQVVRIGSEYPSSFIRFTTLDLLPNFCSGSAKYTISGSTCGNSDGKIIINDVNYFLVYDFTLTDIDGNSFTFNETTGEATGLTSNYYFLTATPKTEWQYIYGYGCIFNWLQVEDLDSTLSLISVRTKQGFCGGFGNDEGRITIRISDSGLTTGITYTLYNERFEVIDSQTITGETFTGITSIVTAASPDVYYVLIENDSGCKILLPAITIQKSDLYTVTGIQRLFITPWDSSISYNYYSSSDEDWYVTGVDTLEYASTKIKEYLGITDYWYEIKLDTARMSYSEVFQKDQNGLTYKESVTITIPRAENSKWKELTNILTDRYMVIFQDNHDQWWTCFYRWGAEVKAYTLADNQYSITFMHPSVNKMLTAIDYDYVKLNCL